MQVRQPLLQAQPGARADRVLLEGSLRSEEFPFLLIPAIRPDIRYGAATFSAIFALIINNLGPFSRLATHVYPYTLIARTLHTPLYC